MKMNVCSDFRMATSIYEFFWYKLPILKAPLKEGLKITDSVKYIENEVSGVVQFISQVISTVTPTNKGSHAIGTRKH